MTGRHLPRRSFLKGLGVSVALPALDAMRPGDPLRAQADDLRAHIQQQLLDAAHATEAPPPPK
jgi:hypothetical protein